MKRQCDKYRKLYLNERKLNIKLKKQTASDKGEIDNFMKICSTEEIEKKTEEIAKLKQQQNETEQSLQYLQSLLDDSSEMLLYDKATNQYLTDTVMCVMNLTNNKIPSEKVGKVIEEVSHLCGMLSPQQQQ